MNKGLCTLLLSGLAVLGAAKAQFPDVPPDHYAEGAITQLADLGIITGFPDGLFRGQKAVNRYELSLVLTRMWSAWSTEQLNDVFSQLTAVELKVAQLKQQQAGFEGELEAVQSLEGRLGRSERALSELDSRTQGVAAVGRAVGGLNAALTKLQGQVEENLGGFDERLDTLSKRTDQGEQETVTLNRRVDTLAGRLDSLGQALLETQEKEAAALWRGSLLAAGGVAGSAADHHIGLSLVTAQSRIGAELTPVGPEVLAETELTPGVTLLGRYHVGLVGNQGAFGVRLSLVSGLAAGFYGGYDTGLAAGAFVFLDGNKEGALPGVLVSAGALTGADAAGGLGNKFLVQVAGGVNFGGEDFQLTPRAFYRRQTGAESAQLVGGELRVGTVQAAFNLAAAARYGIATDLLTAETVGIPEAEVVLTLPSGAFAKVGLSGGLPGLEDLPSFADGSPLQTERLVLGARVGVTLALDELLR